MLKRLANDDLVLVPDVRLPAARHSPPDPPKLQAIEQVLKEHVDQQKEDPHGASEDAPEDRRSLLLFSRIFHRSGLSQGRTPALQNLLELHRQSDITVDLQFAHHEGLHGVQGTVRDGDQIS